MRVPHRARDGISRKGNFIHSSSCRRKQPNKILAASYLHSSRTPLLLRRWVEERTLSQSAVSESALILLSPSSAWKVFTCGNDDNGNREHEAEIVPPGTTSARQWHSFFFVLHKIYRRNVLSSHPSRYGFKTKVKPFIWCDNLPGRLHLLRKEQDYFDSLLSDCIRVNSRTSSSNGITCRDWKQGLLRNETSWWRSFRHVWRFERQGFVYSCSLR